MAEPGLSLRLAVALDTSGSMEGEKLSHAKMACLEIVGMLRPEDRFSLATYSTQVRKQFENLAGGVTARTTAENQLSTINAAGITRTDLALEWIQANLPAEKDVTRVGILITDGKPTNPKGRELEDVSPVTALAGQMGESGVTLCTVGLGNAANFNTAFLAEIGSRGRGTYIYAETPADLTPRLQRRFLASQAVAVDDAKLTLAPLRPGAQINGCCRIRPEFIPFDLPVGGRESAIAIGALRRDIATDILVEVQAPPPDFGEGTGSRPLVEAQITAVGLPTPISSIAEINYTASVLEAQRQDRDVDGDRILWEINANAEELAQAFDPYQTGKLLGNIQQAAANAGHQDIAGQAAHQLDELYKTGELDPAAVSRLLDMTRNRGETE